MKNCRSTPAGWAAWSPGRTAGADDAPVVTGGFPKNGLDTCIGKLVRAGHSVAVECKSGERAVAPAVGYFAARTPIPRFFQVHRGERHFVTGKVAVLPLRSLCSELDLP